MGSVWNPVTFSSDSIEYLFLQTVSSSPGDLRQISQSCGLEGVELQIPSHMYYMGQLAKVTTTLNNYDIKTVTFVEVLL